MPRTNETRFIKWHETCKRKCKIGENVCNNKQRWNKNKCRCKCKEFYFYLFIYFILFNVDFVSFYNETAVLIN